MLNDIERLAVNTWPLCLTDRDWLFAGWQFFGMYRLALRKNDYQAADAAEVIADLAFERQQDAPR
jgi:hypothetical protein